MIYYKHDLGGQQIDFTHPYMTVNQMKKMIRRNYEEPRDDYLYSLSADSMIENLEKTVYLLGIDENLLRMPILVFPIPTKKMWEPVDYGFIVKYEANGETFIFAPIKLWDDTSSLNKIEKLPFEL